MTSTTFAPITGTASAPITGRLARHATLGARCALGFVFFASGLAGLLNVMPPPSGAVPEGALALGVALMKTGYMFPLIKGTETVAGALLLANCFVPLALVILAPVLVNIVAFHAFLTPGDLGLPIALLCLELFLAWRYRGAYRPLLTRRASS
ncbi:MAG TPA: DoxX family protein [Polyangiaceae bacterium]|jgi:uncharacterized membrane protein YphA (DoxX/SURF4 family)|nr:DoxX family protein [Polyangiaceae bacterium]